MNLDVPLVTQKKDSVECGLAGILMILKYYGVKKTYEELQREIKTDETGTYSPQLGSYLIGLGFDVEIVTLHPKLFMLADKNLTQEEILQRFNLLHERVKSPKDKENIEKFTEFMKKGGKIKVKIPMIEDVKEEIDQKRPVCALLTSNFLSGKQPIFNFHFNIITGYDDKNIYVNDPLWDERGGKKKYAIQDFFYGLYASAYGDADNASLMKVKKRK
jgi:hypothetical protein